MNRELLQAIYDHRAICTAVEQRQEERALELWAEKPGCCARGGSCRAQCHAGGVEPEPLRSYFYGCGERSAEFRHASREMYIRTLPRRRWKGIGPR